MDIDNHSAHNPKKPTVIRKIFGRKTLLIMIDIACLLTAYALTFTLANLSTAIRVVSGTAYMMNILFTLFSIMAMRFILRVYSNVWRYANSKAYLSMVVADTMGGLISFGLTRICYGLGIYVHLGIWQLICIVTFFDLATLVSRFGYQQTYQRRNLNEIKSRNQIGVAIVGAGKIGALLAEELIYNKQSHYKPICFIENDPVKVGSRVCGLKVYNDDSNIIAIIKSLDVQEIFIAIPTLTSEQAKRLHEKYILTGCKVKIYDFPLKATSSDDPAFDSSRRILREIKIEDLLFRDVHNIDIATLVPYYSGKTILVTGGGGSIGSELCRQLAKCKPAKLIVLDIYENNAYAIQQELIRKYGAELDLCVEIASVRDIERLDCIFAAYRPDVVFHAAAHKHVPLMEHSSCEAIKNNVMGTYNTADMAEKYGVKKFILISTDKAVNPTNIMGASKRMCEMVIQCRGDSATSFSAVRFGNVLGSNGSVIPLFREQIANGGPITLTDKRIIRYFMTIPEASQLVMQAGAMAKSGELFALDMGKPIKILDMAENMIRLAGFQPYVDIDIVEIGLRPGEKLYEELLIKTETLDKTDNELIFIERDTPLSREAVEEKLALLRDAIDASKSQLEAPAIKEAMMKVVPTYREPDKVNKRAYRSEEMKAANEPSAHEEEAQQNHDARKELIPQ